jgi:hypothetical protein
LVEKGAYVISQHAQLRQDERYFTVGDIKNVILHGYHEKRKDEHKPEFNDWNYAIRGETLDGEKARVCIAFDKRTTVIIITVIRLEE